MRVLIGYVKTASTKTSWVCSLLVVFATIGASSLALASLTLSSTREASAVESFEYGLRIGHAFSLSDAQLNAQLNKAVSARATTVQVMASWRILAPSAPRQYNWGYLDRTVAAAESRGLKVHLQLEKTPSWMNATDTYPPTTATELQQWRDFCFDVAKRYGTRVAHYEVWNEPNLQGFWSTGPDPVKWAALLRSGYLGLKDANPNVTVTSGGISLNDLGFLRRTYAAIKAYPDAAANNNFFDELGLHPYSAYGPLPQTPIPPDQTLAAARWTNKWGPASANFPDFAWMHNEMVAQGDGAKKIYIGEYGFSTTQTWMLPVPDAVRADYLKRAYAVAQNTAYISGLTWFSYVEEPPWAIVDSNLNESLTFQAFREVTSNMAPPPLPADTTPPETTIDSGPSGTVDGGSASFAFSSSEAGSTFECSLDGGAFASCSTPKSYANLSGGSHTFEVRATDAAGNTDATPADRSWTNDTAAPVPPSDLRTLNASAVADTHIAKSTPMVTYGSTVSLHCDGDEPTGTGQDVYPLLRFDLSGIPAGSTVSSAKLVLNVTNTTSQTYEAYTLEKAWVEKEASWRWSRNYSWWEMGGARGATDRSRTSLASLTPGSFGQQAFDLNTSGVAQVQEWLDGPVADNGLIVADASNTDGFDFFSREVPDPSLRPVLQVAYTPA